MALAEENDYEDQGVGIQDYFNDLQKTIVDVQTIDTVTISSQLASLASTMASGMEALAQGTADATDFQGIHKYLDTLNASAEQIAKLQGMHDDYTKDVANSATAEEALGKMISANEASVARVNELEADKQNIMEQLKIQQSEVGRLSENLTNVTQRRAEYDEKAGSLVAKYQTKVNEINEKLKEQNISSQDMTKLTQEKLVLEGKIDGVEKRRTEFMKTSVDLEQDITTKLKDQEQVYDDLIKQTTSINEDLDMQVSFNEIIKDDLMGFSKEMGEHNRLSGEYKERIEKILGIDQDISKEITDQTEKQVKLTEKISDSNDMVKATSESTTQLTFDFDAVSTSASKIAPSISDAVSQATALDASLTSATRDRTTVHTIVTKKVTEGSGTISTGGGPDFNDALKKHMNAGGVVVGPSGRDVIPAMLTAGEFVVNANASEKYLPLLQAINSGKVPMMNAGGYMGKLNQYRDVRNTATGILENPNYQLSGQAAAQANFTGDQHMSDVLNKTFNQAAANLKESMDVVKGAVKDVENAAIEGEKQLNDLATKGIQNTFKLIGDNLPTAFKNATKESQELIKSLDEAFSSNRLSDVNLNDEIKKIDEQIKKQYELQEQDMALSNNGEIDKFVNSLGGLFSGITGSSTDDQEARATSLKINASELNNKLESFQSDVGQLTGILGQYKMAQESGVTEIKSALMTVHKPNGPGFSSGGPVSGPMGKDVIPAMLTDGEFVVRADVAKNWRGFLEYLNETGTLGMAKGGPVGFNAGGSVGGGGGTPTRGGGVQPGVPDAQGTFSVTDIVSDTEMELSKLHGELLTANTIYEDLVKYAEKLNDEGRDAHEIQKLVATQAEEIKKQSELRLEVGDKNLASLHKQRRVLEVMEKFKLAGLRDSFIGMFDAVEEKINGILGSLPLVGSTISTVLKTSVGPAFDTLRKGASDGFNEMALNISDQFDKITENGQKFDLSKLDVDSVVKSFTDKFLPAVDKARKILTVAFSVIKAMGPALLTVVLPLVIIGGLIAFATKRFFALEEKAKEFREGLGLAADQAKQVEKNANAVQRELAGFGVTLDHAYEAATALTEQMGSTMLVTKDQIALVSQLSASLGVAAGSAAGVYEAFLVMGDGSAETAKNLTLATTALATAAGVPLGAVMDDIANASDSVYAFSRGTGEQLAIAAVEARRLGTNIESVTGSMEKALDFESSIQGEMRMATMLGKHISMDAMRRASFEGDQVKFMQEQRNVMQQVGDLSQMNMYQRQAVAEAMGMEVGELMKMQQKEKGLQALASGTAEQRKLLAEYEQMQADIQGGRVKDVAKEAEEMIRQEKAQLVKERLMNQINKIVAELGTVLLPVVESAMSVIVPIVSMLLSGFGKLIKVVEFFLQPIIFIGNVIRALTGDTDGLKDQFDGLGKSIFAIAGIIAGLSLIFVKSWTGVFSWLPGSMGTALESGFTKASGAMKKYIWEPFTGLLDDMTGGLTGLFSGDAENASDGFFGKIKDKVKGMFGGGDAPETPGPLKKDGTPDMRFAENRDAMKPGVDDKTKSVSDSVKSVDDGGIPDVDPAKGDRFKELVEKFNSIDMKKVLQAAAALLVLSAALLVTAIALTQFNKVEWQSVLKGVVAIGMLVGGLYLMSEVLKASQANLLQGAVAILAMGVALVPFAYALTLLSDVNWLSIAMAGITLVGLAMGAMILGGVASSPPFWMGVAGIAALGAALIPFSVAAVIAGVAFNLVAFAFSTMVTALQSLTPGDIFNLALLAGAMYALGLAAPMAIIATVTLTAFAVAMIPLAVGLAIAGAGITLFGLGLSMVIETIKQLPMAAVAIGVFAFAMSLIAPLAPAMIITGIAIAFLGAALIPFGIGALIAGAGMFLIATSFSIMVSALESLSMGSIAMLYALGASFAFLATMLPFAILGAITLGIFAAAMIPLAVGLLIAGVAITIFGAGLSLVMGTLLQLPQATASLMAFVFGISLLAPLVPAMILTAVGLAILGVALVPFGIGAIVAGAGMYIMAQALAVMASANPAKLLFEIGAAFMFLGMALPAIVLGAVALAAMTLVLIPFSIALAVAGAGVALFGLGLGVAINSMLLLPAAAVGLIMFGIAISLLGPMIPLIILGAAALVIMAAAMIPFGVSLLVVGVGLTMVSIGFYIMAQAINSINVANLFGLIGAFILMGASLPIILLGALAMTIMTVALIPLGVAAAVAGLGLMVFAFAFSMLTDSINRLDMANFFGLIGGFILMGAMLPVIILGAVALTIMSAALVPLGVAALIAGAGMFVFAGAFHLFATAMSMIPDGTVGTLFGIAIAMTLIGASVVAAIFASAALVTFAGGLAVFAVAAMATGAAVSVLALGMSVLANSLSQIASEGLAAIAGLAILGLISPLLFMAAGGILALSGALVVMGAAQAAAGILSMFSSDENPFAMYIELGEHAEALNAASQGLSSIADSMSKLGEVDVGDIFEAIGEGFEEIFDVIDDIGEDTLAKFDLVAGSFKSLFSCIADIMSDGLDITPLLGFMTALPMMATSIASMTGGGGGGGFFGGLFGEEESPIDSFVGSLSSMGDAMAKIAPGAESFNTLIQTLGGSAETLQNATSGLDMLTGAVYRFSEALDELGPFGMIMLGAMTAMGISQDKSQEASPSGGGGRGGSPGVGGGVGASPSPTQALGPAAPDATQTASPSQATGSESTGSAFNMLPEGMGTSDMVNHAMGELGIQDATPTAPGGPAAATGGMISAQQAIQSGEMSGDLAGSSTPGEASPVAQANATIQAQEVKVEASGSEAGGAPSAEQMATGGPGGATPMPEVVQQVASVPSAAPMAGGESGGSAGVESRLDELIGLLKSGKLGVNLDGKKVEKQLAKAAP